MSLEDNTDIEPAEEVDLNVAPAARKQQIPTGQLGFLVLSGLACSAFFFIGTPFVIEQLTMLVLKSLPSPESTRLMPISQIGSSILGFITGLGIGNLIWRAVAKAKRGWDKTPIGGKVTTVVAVFIGLMACVPFLFFLNALLSNNYAVLISAMVALVVGFTTLSVYVLQSIADVLPWNQGQVKGKRSDVKIIDTNIFIDGRIYEVARTGFFEGPFYVPGFVLEELQSIADSADSLRRQRGRRGLEVLRHLQADFEVEVRTHDKLAGTVKEEVDHRLVRLARALGASIVTNDFNLNRVAKIQDVTVLNLNDLALSLRPNVLPSEGMLLTIVKEGNQPSQGIGYLEDGTMVVVDGGKKFIGENIEVVVSQVIQTERGKMIFANPAIDPFMDIDEEQPQRRNYRS